MRDHMRGLAAALVVALLLGTSWTGRGPAAVANAQIDPSLQAGDVALVHVTSGSASSVAAKLDASGATEITTLDAIDVVEARLSGAALASVAADSHVKTVASDAVVSASGDSKNKPLDNHGANQSGDSAGPRAINAPHAWTVSTGRGVTVAVMDSGVADHPYLVGKIAARVNFVDDKVTEADPAGHGTHLAGVIAGRGEDFRGVAPDARVVSLRVLDKQGNGKLKDVLQAFDWLLRNHRIYNVRVVNLSFGATQTTTYHNDILSAVVESVWFAGMTVVAAAGNDGPNTHTITTPGSDPFVLTVGSFDDQGTTSTHDDVLSSFSSRGPTKDGFAKPDVLAPGRKVVSLRVPGSQLETDLPDRVVIKETKDPQQAQREFQNSLLIRMTGTSVSSAMAAGVAALVLSIHPTYSPTQVKGAIVASGRNVNGSATRAVDAYRALSAMSSVNSKLVPSKLLLKTLADAGIKLSVAGVTWEVVTWEGVTWEGVTWEGVTWESVTWEGVVWERVKVDGK